MGNFRWACSGMPMHCPKILLKLYIPKNVGVPKLILGPLPLGEKGSYEIPTVSRSVSMSVDKHFSPKWLL